MASNTSLADRTLPVVRSLWDDRRRFHEAVDYLESCYERMLPRLAAYLNSAHQVSFSERYWRVLIGPWLLHFLHVTYDRVAHLTQAVPPEPSLPSLEVEPERFDVPQDTQTFVELTYEDVFNVRLTSRLMRGMNRDGPPTWAWRDARCGGVARVAPRQERRVRLVARRLLWGAGDLLRRLMWRRCRVGLCQSEVPQADLWAMAWHSRGRLLPLNLAAERPGTFPRPQFDERRCGLAELPATDAFERLTISLLPHYVPLVYLEAYHAAREAALAQCPVPPPMLASAVGWYFHEPFKFVAADAAQRGGRLVAIQHGSVYGLSRFFPLERHERRICDTFMVWGWAPQDEPHASQLVGEAQLRNLPSPKLAVYLSQRPSRATDQATTILFVAATNPRYLYRFCSVPQGAQMADYFAWERRFLRALPETLRRALLFRLHEHDFGHDRKARLSAEFPDLRWDGYPPLPRRIRESRLVIVDHLSTPLLEALRSNVPTVLFWDPQRWEVREEAEPYLQRLREAGILWETPEAAAAHVAAVYERPETWWRQDAVQLARGEFLERYAFTCADWMSRWVSAFEREWRLGVA